MMRRTLVKKTNSSHGTSLGHANRNYNIKRQERRQRPAYANLAVALCLIVILNFLRQSLHHHFKSNLISNIEERSLPRIEGITSPSGSLSSLGSIDSAGTSANPNTDVDIVANNNIPVKFTPPTSSANFSLISYSYNTTDVEEFRRLHRNYLLRNQQQNSLYLSTQAREKDTKGNLITTYAYASKFSFGFHAGFRNQMMALTMLVLRANYDGHEQLLLDSLWHKDTYGTNRFDPFDFYFDVEHWNRHSHDEGKNPDNTNSRNRNQTNPEHHPNWLPRMVLYDPSVHDQWDSTSSTYKTRDIFENATRPYGYIKKGSKLGGNFQFYAKGKSKYTPPTRAGEKPIRNPGEILMLQGALRPHLALQAVVNRSKQYLRERANMEERPGFASPPSMRSSFRYMTIHARIEPDMQHHPVCKDKKVLTLREIVDMVESKWPETPPVDVVFIPINRQYLEKEGTLPKNYENGDKSDGKINWIAVDNLRLLNQLTNHNNTNGSKSVGGMWNGKVPIVEFGSKALRGTVYEKRPSTSGAILNYFLALDAHIFVGTEVSSFSHDVLAARFFRGFNDSDTNAYGTDIHVDALDAENGEKNTENEVRILTNTDSSKSDNRFNPRKNNYKYLPSGLKEWIADDMVAPPGFVC